MAVCPVLGEHLAAFGRASGIGGKDSAFVSSESGGSKRQARVLKGFRDYMPEQMILRQRIISIFRGIFEQHGFEPLDTPALEHLEVLLGKAEPGGRLAESLPVATSGLPADANFPGLPRQVQYRECQWIGYRFHDTFGVPARFPFGHGLGYTTWSLGALRVRGAGTPGHPSAPPILAPWGHS